MAFKNIIYRSDNNENDDCKRCSDEADRMVALWFGHWTTIDADFMRGMVKYVELSKGKVALFF